MSEKREYTAADFEETLDDYKTWTWEHDLGWLRGDEVKAALRLASAVMRPGVIEDAMKRTRLYDDIPTAIRKALLGEAEDAGR